MRQGPLPGQAARHPGSQATISGCSFVVQLDGAPVVPATAAPRDRAANNMRAASALPYVQGKWGEQSPYGAELVPLLRSVAGKGAFDAADYSQVRALHARTLR